MATGKRDFSFMAGQAVGTRRSADSLEERTSVEAILKRILANLPEPV